MLTTVLAYSLIASYFVVERSLRKGSAALSLKPSESDAGSSKLLGISGGIGLLLVIAAPLLNRYQVGYWDSTAIAYLGLIIMVCGLSLRYWAARVLGEFYTRTLQTVADQKIIDKAPYSVVRHPGYLGTFLLSIGAGLALMNWLVLVVSVAIEMTAKAYRIRVEEQMLTTTFGDEFDEYVSKTWKLLPYLY